MKPNCFETHISASPYFPSPPTSPSVCEFVAHEQPLESRKRIYEAIVAAETQPLKKKAQEPKRKHAKMNLNPLRIYTHQTPLPRAERPSQPIDDGSQQAHRAKTEATLGALLHNDKLDPTKKYGSENATPLHIASSLGHAKGVSILLQHPAIHKDAIDSAGQTPVHRAVRFNHPAILELLLERGARLDVQDLKGHLPLHLAVMHNSTACFSLLLKHQYYRTNNPSHLNTLWTLSKSKHTPVDKVIICGHAGFLKRILQEQAWKTHTHHTHLLVRLAVTWNRIGCLDILIDAHCSLDTAPVHDPSDTPLMRAVEQRKIDMVHKLIEAGANPCDEQGTNHSLLYAANHGFMDMAALLLTHSTSQECLSEALAVAESVGCRHELVSILHAFQKTSWTS